MTKLVMMPTATARQSMLMRLRWTSKYVVIFPFRHAYRRFHGERHRNTTRSFQLFLRTRPDRVAENRAPGRTDSTARREATHNEALILEKLEATTDGIEPRSSDDGRPPVGTLPRTRPPLRP